jgi:uncharacterized protein (TIRG00374 family)
MKSKNKIHSLILSIVLTVLLLWSLFKNVPPKKIKELIHNVHFKFFITAFLFHFGAYYFRSLILYSFLKQESIDYFYIFNAHMIHNFYCHLIPANLGELSLPLLLKKDIDMKKTFSVLLISRFFTFILLILLFIIIFFTSPDYSKIVTSNVKNRYYFLIPILMILLFVFLSLENIKQFLSKYRWTSWLFRKVNEVFQIMKSQSSLFKKWQFLTKIILYSMGSIFSTCLFNIMILKGINIDLTIIEVIFINTIWIFVMILPIKSVGGFGITEWSWALGLLILGYSKKEAIEAGFVVHIYTLINVIFLFCVGILIKYLVFKKSKKNQKNFS